MITPIAEAQGTTAADTPQPLGTPVAVDAMTLRRRSGSGGFISITSICEIVDHRRKRTWKPRTLPNAGR